MSSASDTFFGFPMAIVGEPTTMDKDVARVKATLKRLQRINFVPLGALSMLEQVNE